MGVWNKALGCAAVVAVAWGALAEPVQPAQIRTIFEKNCVECHGPEKQKHNLRLDSIEAIQQGGKGGPLFIAGNPDESLIVHFITLPEGDEDLMPPKGPLPSKEIEAIRQWIADGASFENWDAEYVEPQLMFAAVTVAQGGPAAAAPLFGEELLKQLAEGLELPAAEVLEPIKDAGVRIAPLDQSSPLLQADLKFVPDGATDEHLALLAPVAANITWINLAGSRVTDAGLAVLAGMPRLTSIHLERTGVTDAALAHLASLSHLEYLNLFGTKVSDAGIATLAALPGLKRLYAWQTGVTAEGAQALAAALPQLAINMGTEQKPLEALVYNDPAEDLARMEAEKAADAGAPLFDPFAPEEQE
jgi:mono/diheme cytochrome c family protein